MASAITIWITVFIVLTVIAFIIYYFVLKAWKKDEAAKKKRKTANYSLSQMREI